MVGDLFVDLLIELIDDESGSNELVLLSCFELRQASSQFDTCVDRLLLICKLESHVSNVLDFLVHKFLRAHISYVLHVLINCLDNFLILLESLLAQGDVDLKF